MLIGKKKEREASLQGRRALIKRLTKDLLKRVGPEYFTNTFFDQQVDRQTFKNLLKILCATSFTDLFEERKFIFPAEI